MQDVNYLNAVCHVQVSSMMNELRISHHRGNTKMFVTVPVALASLFMFCTLISRY